MVISTAKPVTVDLTDLQTGNISEQQLENAFGPHSLGIIVVTGLPDHYPALRKKVLQSAKKLASLPEAELAKLEAPEAYWLVGWSIGKEKLVNGEPDYTKGSYYSNCNFYRYPTKEAPDEETIKKFQDLKGYISANKWPPNDLLPEFQQDLKKLVSEIIDVTQSVAAVCDRYMVKYLDSKSSFQLPENYLQNLVANSDSTKARLLHYLAPENAKSNDTSNWCGEHLDHSCLTALTSNYYMDIDDTSMEEVILPEDHASGLFIRDRHDELVKVEIPTDALAFQTGSALAEITGGKFKAVSHLVLGAKDETKLCRNTLAVFCQPSLADKVNDAQTFADYSRMILKRNH